MEFINSGPENWDLILITWPVPLGPALKPLSGGSLSGSLFTIKINSGYQKSHGKTFQ